MFLSSVLPGWRDGFDKLSLATRMECQAELIESLVKQRPRRQNIVD